MRVFISFTPKDKALAAKLERALRLRNVETWSSLNLPPGEDWSDAVNQASASAEAYIFLLRPGIGADPRVQSEWRCLLRNNWDDKKTLIPIAASKGLSRRQVLPFLRRRFLLRTANFEKLLDRIVYFLEHPAESIDHSHDAEIKREAIREREEFNKYVLALKKYNAQAKSGAERR